MGCSGSYSFFTRAEVTGVVKKLHSDKTSGVEEIGTEDLRTVNVFGLSWLTSLFNIT